MTKEITQKPITIRRLPAKRPRKEITSQGVLDLRIDRQAEVEGVGMGVLSDGTPFLTQRGLARLCGVQNAHIGTIEAEWAEPNQKPRISSIRDLLAKRGVTLDVPYIEVRSGGQVMHAYPDAACVAILEYYAFEAGANCKEEAKTAFRTLAGRALRDFIYERVGYAPERHDAWELLKARLSLVNDHVPAGYWCIFKEGWDVAVTLIGAGLKLGPETVVDLSMGGCWGRHWTDAGLAAEFGERIPYAHYYPTIYPQSASNPQDAHAYPDAALREFRRWARDEYLPEKLPPYLLRKAKEGKFDLAIVQTVLVVMEDRRMRLLQTG